jgi:bifunctional non-homologous end joining protein LigD
MLATTGIPPQIDRWAAEPKLDGWRARLLVDGDDLILRTRSGRSITDAVPIVTGLAGLRVVLDGELVADAGRLDDFYRLGPSLARKPRIRASQVSFVAFDLLWADGDLLCGVPYEERRRRLEELDLPARGVPVVPSVGWGADTGAVRGVHRARRRRHRGEGADRPLPPRATFGGVAEGQV